MPCLPGMHLQHMHTPECAQVTITRSASTLSSSGTSKHSSNFEHKRCKTDVQATLYTGVVFQFPVVTSLLHTRDARYLRTQVAGKPVTQQSQLNHETMTSKFKKF